MSETGRKSTDTELHRAVGLAHGPRPKPAPALELEAEIDLRGKSKLRAFACSPLAIIAVVLIVLIIVAGKVLIARSGLPRGEPRREDLGSCTERIQRTCTEVIERACVRNG